MSLDSALEAAVDEVAGLLNTRIGLRPEPTLRGRLRRSIRDEALAHGHDPQTYVSILLSQQDALQRLLNRVTVQETGFFRHPEHFEVLARDVLPGLPGPVTIWSAGCANGQEAYSLAMVLEEQGVAGSVIATDLSTAALHRTAAARYSPREVTGLSPARIARHLTAVGSNWQINDAVRARVSTARHNLVDPLLDRVRGCQIVFCRNVLIYFTADHTRAFLDRVADALPEGGYLFLGSAETIWLVSDRFDTVRIDDTFVYRCRPAAVSPVGLEPHSQVSADSGRERPAAAARARRQGTPRRGARRIATRTGAQPAGAENIDSAQQLATAGRKALTDGELQPAIVAFRSWAYLAPDDAMAHLHLGLALEAAGDQPSARRAFGAAERAVLEADQAKVEHAIGGYAPDELLRLLESKHVTVMT
jgi:chemotaxis protein methyltransferase CheR